ncbi:MAG: epoxyqueuosine reductase QueH [Atribacterota bacterium]|nr:epoxyqueuosine reductase QueH [Atribacterota bacterium]
MKELVLLHTCCAPCSIYVSEFFEREGFEVIHMFYNPNIHPFEEYRRRWETLSNLIWKTGRKLVAPFPYNPLEYFSIIQQEEERCPRCYRLRLTQVARWGKEHGFPLFSTTLTISPYQDVTCIQQIGEEVGNEFGVTFVGIDFRKGFAESMRRAKELNLYRQKYCGCIFSWWEGVKKGVWKSLTGQSSS